ncbi:methyltransferase [Eisenibacter elegans]|jgi:methylase of polypeptide subunit release factors|uniref:methyltransferase n=1 Tax=Eisenibacter elegans TaxID=997 RepID=UPI00040AAE29|nr:methyltransferase [Eisenibacter elegans]
MKPEQKTPNHLLREHLNLKKYRVVGRELEMLVDPSVWQPYSATEMLNFLYTHQYLDHLGGKTVLDMGTGTGIIGIACALLGAKQITLTDYCQPAVQIAKVNARLNGFKDAESIQSDRFQALEGKTFDLIISNPPVQPWLFTDLDNEQERISSAAWNEAGADGRLVLDALIQEAQQYLNIGGKMITSCSSRHGHRRTIELFNKHWGLEWTHIYTYEHAIDPSYHQPYMDTWLFLQEMDLDLRVYQKDANGRKFATQKDFDGYSFIITTVVIEGEEVAVKFMQTEDGWAMLDADNQLIRLCPPNDPDLPGAPIDQHWYYLYYLIEATNYPSIIHHIDEEEDMVSEFSDDFWQEFLRNFPLDTQDLFPPSDETTP